MGMFDTVRAYLVGHSGFKTKHNGMSFQTKDLENNLSEYCIFNGVLYEVRDGKENVRHPQALESEYTGVLNIYTHTSDRDFEYWIEYDLTFKQGRISDVFAYEEEITKDKRDLSEYRPALPGNRVVVTLNIDDLNPEQQAAFAEAIPNKLDAIRELIEQPTATIYYPIKPEERENAHRLRWPNNVRYLSSVVQSMADIQSVPNGGRADIEAPNGDHILVVLDEFGQFGSRGE